MIKKIFQDKQDIDNLAQRMQSAQVPPAAVNYKNVVVNKPWGYEYLLYENAQVAIWILFLKKDAKTSMHCHPKKRTSLLVLEGEVKTTSLCEGFDLKTLDSLIIDKGVFHSTGTEFESGAFIMEIETPPEKTDLVRLSDQYGRENKGYESGPDISNELEKYEHQSFDDDSTEERRIIEKVIRQSRIVLHTKENWASLYDEVMANQFCIMSFLDTSVLDANNETVLDVGEMCEREWFLERYSELHSSGDSFTVLSVY